ncbi:GNAT family N-acetyltransferase [Streptomyces kronopolitis]|uniref:GNAT family N-acetyltransferase n=1 Tax=Streptomyces kronopolitis TaxID=1612435 RepID=UPI0020BF5021|nr:GNAT family N-acetyltransferase [Streptomyces kronopolitis]MCL6299508.1 GNAT family N-acetyltransferase [Streptomyces kronopolitis]
MVTLRALGPDDATALTRIYSGASIRHTTGQPLTLDQAHEKIRTALARATETPRAQWSWGILATDEMIGLISLRRRTPSMGTLSYILREDTWGNGYATEAVKHIVDFACTTAGLDRLKAMHHPDNPASGHVLTKAGFTRTGTADRPADDGCAVAYQVYALPLL